MKAIKYIAIGIGSILGIRYLFSLNRAKDKVLTVVTAQRDKITAQGIGVLIKYNIKNPTRATLRMVPPLIKLSANGKLLASSTMQEVDIPSGAKDSSGRIVIEAFKETGEITSKILIPWLSIAQLVPQILTRLQSADAKDKVSVQIETLSHVYTRIGDYPFEDITTLKL